MEKRQKHRQKQRRVPMKNLLLRSLAVAGVISIALIAPKMTRLLKELDRPAKNRTQLYRRINQGVARLEADGLVTVSGAYAERRVLLTEKGRKRVEEIEFGEYAIPEPAFWDGKWRGGLFGIRVPRRRAGDQLAVVFYSPGVVRGQNS